MSELDWISGFQEFFHSRRNHLSEVLGAIGCREGWLQAEAFRYFRKKNVAIYTNYLVLPGQSGKRNRKADFAFYESHADDARLELVAELKVYGERGFYPKGLTGGDLREARRRVARTNPLVMSNQTIDRQMLVGPGILADYFRLVDFNAGEDSPVRLLLLCVQKAAEPDNFGKILSQIEFEKSGETLLDTPKVWVKAWVVGGDSKRG